MAGKKFKPEFLKLVGKRDPSGFFIVPAHQQALEFLNELVDSQANIVVEDIGGGIVFLKTKSRTLAQKLLKVLKSRGLTAYNEL